MAINTRKYHNQAGKRTIHCGLCRTAGHNRTSCPMIDEWAKEYEKWLNEHQGSAQGMPCAWRIDATAKQWRSGGQAFKKPILDGDEPMLLLQQP